MKGQAPQSDGDGLRHILCGNQTTGTSSVRSIDQLPRIGPEPEGTLPRNQLHHLGMGLAALSLFAAACSSSQPAAPTPVPVAPATAGPSARPTGAPATAANSTPLPVAQPLVAQRPAAVTAPIPAIQPAPPGRLEIFSWWTTGGEAAGLNALFDQYKRGNPGVDIINATVAGGAGSNAKAVLKTRMLGGAPPDSFQIHMGHELTDTWVVTGKMEPLDDIYTQMGWNTAFPKGVLDIVSYNGKPYSVPVNIHRANVLWYNTKVFSENGLTPPETFDDFFAVADVLKGKGITPLAFADQEGFESRADIRNNRHRRARR